MQEPKTPYSSAVLVYLDLLIDHIEDIKNSESKRSDSKGTSLYQFLNGVKAYTYNMKELLQRQGSEETIERLVKSYTPRDDGMITEIVYGDEEASIEIQKIHEYISEKIEKKQVPSLDDMKRTIHRDHGYLNMLLTYIK